MSAAASSSKLSQKPREASTSGRAVTRLTKARKSLPTVSVEEQKDIQNPRGYGFDSLTNNHRLEKFIIKSAKNELTTIRHMSQVLSGLPYKSRIMRSKKTLDKALEEYNVALEKGSEAEMNFQHLKWAAENVASWERAIFSTKLTNKDHKRQIRARKTLTRKLLLVPKDEALYPALALADQAEHFADINDLNLGRWISLHTSFIAFDFVAAHILPQSVEPLPLHPEREPFAKVPLEPSVVDAYINLLGEYQYRMDVFIESFVEPPVEGQERRGIFALIKNAYLDELQGATVCNIASAVLFMRFLLRDCNADNGEFVVETMIEKIEADAKKSGFPLPDDFFDLRKKTSACTAFLCAALISPLTLFTGQRLYGQGPALPAEAPFMIWQQLAHIERPPWVVKRERQATDLLWHLTWADDNKVDMIETITKHVMIWDEDDVQDPPKAKDADFFVSLISPITNRREERIRQKRNRVVSARIEEQTDSEEGQSEEDLAESKEEEMRKEEKMRKEEEEIERAEKKKREEKKRKGEEKRQKAEEKRQRDEDERRKEQQKKDETAKALERLRESRLKKAQAQEERSKIKDTEKEKGGENKERGPDADADGDDDKITKEPDADEDMDVDDNVREHEDSKRDGLFIESSTDADNRILTSNEQAGLPQTPPPVPLLKSATPYDGELSWPQSEAQLAEDDDEGGGPPSSSSSASSSRAPSRSATPTVAHKPSGAPSLVHDPPLRAVTPDCGQANRELIQQSFGTDEIDEDVPRLTSEQARALRAATPRVEALDEGIPRLTSEDARTSRASTPLAGLLDLNIPFEKEIDESDVEDKDETVDLAADSAGERAYKAFSNWIATGQGPLDVEALDEEVRALLGPLYKTRRWASFYRRGMHDELKEGWNMSLVLSANKRHVWRAVQGEAGPANDAANAAKRKRNDEAGQSGEEEGQGDVGSPTSEDGQPAKKLRLKGPEEPHTATDKPMEVDEMTVTEEPTRKKLPATFVETESDSDGLAKSTPLKDKDAGEAHDSSINEQAAHPGNNESVSPPPASIASASSSKQKPVARSSSSPSLPAVSVRRSVSRKPSRPPPTFIGMEKTYQQRTLTEARSIIRNRWDSMDTHDYESDKEIYEQDEEEEEEEEEEAVNEDGAVVALEEEHQSTPIISWGRSFVASHSFYKSVDVELTKDDDVAMEDVEDENADALSTIDEEDEDKEDEEEDEEDVESDRSEELEPETVTAQQIIAQMEKDDEEIGPDPSDSDREHKYDDDSDESVDLSDDGIPLDVPFKCANDNDPDDLKPRYLYDVRVALPKTVRWRGRNLFRVIHQDMENLVYPGGINFLKSFSFADWLNMPPAKIDKTMDDGNVIVIHETNVHHGWKFNMQNAARIRSPAQPVEVQDFCNRYKPTGVHNHRTSLQSVVDPDHRDANKVLNMLDAPQPVPLVQIPRQSDFDFGTMAWKYRKDLLRRDAGILERDLDMRIQTGLNWAIISQKHAVSLGHVDTAGVYTAITILDGIKYWAVRKTALKPGSKSSRKGKEKDVDDLGYFVDLSKRDIESLPGGSTEWVAIVLFPGDVLIIPPNARHCVFTIKDSMMAGIHFYHWTQLERSTCGWITSRFATTQISNAEHTEFLSVLQSFASFWWPGFSQTQKSRFTSDDAVMRSLPHPATSAHGLSNLVSLAVALVFNDALSGEEKPYRWMYYEADRLAFKKIWNSVTRDGYMVASKLNYNGDDYKKIIKAGVPKGVKVTWDDRWTCAGLGQLLIHVARAIISLSLLWEKHRDKKYAHHSRAMELAMEKLDEDVNIFLKPEVVYKRVVSDVSCCLGLELEVVKDLIGDLQDCTKLPVTSIFPTSTWVAESPRQSKRLPGLWDAFYVPKTDELAVKDERRTAKKPVNNDDMDEDDTDAQADDESDPDFQEGKSAKFKGRKSAKSRGSKASKARTTSTKKTGKSST